MATAMSVPGGAISYTRTSFLVTQSVAGLRSAGAAKRLNALRAPRIASGCEAAFRGVRCKATMAGKEMQVGQADGRAAASADLLVVGPGVLGSLVGRRWLEVGRGNGFVLFCGWIDLYCRFEGILI
jgi:hypothetical protein